MPYTLGKICYRQERPRLEKSGSDGAKPGSSGGKQRATGIAFVCYDQGGDSRGQADGLRIA